ncbi:hypothetical protein [Klebsiella phage vB_KpnS-VAC4]|uniref:Uncharacterized protein n=1 Tax=Klebsiella phage vB_KpnS-VAC4 TaxID=2864362 RepID=A0AAE7XGH9_9CAUD|nr:hypothetical protein [Klebsiella phage vB_KpnS-VAC4]
MTGSGLCAPIIQARFSSVFRLSLDLGFNTAYD